MNKMENKEKTQLERLLEALVMISPDVTTEDKNLAAGLCDIHTVTVNRYLRGLGGDSDVAATLITFFKQRISERDQAIV